MRSYNLNFFLAVRREVFIIVIFVVTIQLSYFYLIVISNSSIIVVSVKHFMKVVTCCILKGTLVLLPNGFRRIFTVDLLKFKIAQLATLFRQRARLESLTLDAVSENRARVGLVGTDLAIVSGKKSGFCRVGVALAPGALARSGSGAEEVVVGAGALGLVLEARAVVAGPIQIAAAVAANAAAVAGTQLAVVSEMEESNLLTCSSCLP